MSSKNLPDLATQQLQQVHNLVLSFQALENDLRDTFQEIQKEHQNEIKKYQNQIRELKGKEEQSMSNNPYAYATSMKANPMNMNNSHSNNAHNINNNNVHSPISPMSPQGSPNMANNNYSNKIQQKMQIHKQIVNNQGGAQPQRNSNYSNIPAPMQPQNYANRNSINKNHDRKSRSHGMGFVPPPPSQPPPNGGYNNMSQQRPSQHKYNNGAMSKSIGGHGTLVNQNNKKDDEKSVPKMQNNASKTSSNNNKNNTAPKKKINLMPEKTEKPKKKVFGFLNKNKITEADRLKPKEPSLPPGISERDFYKKYWIEAGKIGEGAFARVRKITRKTDKAVFALKMIKKKGKSSEDIAALQREILVLQKCDHKNIVQLGDWCDTKKRIYMVVEFCDGGDVFERVVQYKKFSEKSAIHVIHQVASGLEHIHSLGYVHRDLKPDNLMYLTKDIDSEIKIIDFGLAGDCNDGPCKTPCGTAHYAAPEVLSSKEYGIMSDLWSLGVIIYTLLCGFPPFFDASNNMKNLYHLIKKGSYSFPSPFWDDISDDAKDLISKLLVLDPKQRLNSQQVLKHRWVKNVANAKKKELGVNYVNQMEHWQSTRQATEFGLGQDAPPPPPEQPINLYYDKQLQSSN